MRNKKILYFFGVLLSFSMGGFSAIYIKEEISDDTINQKRQASDYAFINPLLECEIETIGSQQKYIPFEKKLKNEIKTSIIEKNPDIYLSVYFRNLRNGPWFGINEETSFAPASLMKLPVAIAYLKWLEIRPEIGSQIFIAKKEEGVVQNVIPAKNITIGSGYTMDALIQYSLLYSDNNANKTLLQNIPKENLFSVFRDLSIPIIQEVEKGIDEYISVKEYASFFRILYNASYLERASSEYLLRTMASSEFQRGIRKSIPNDILVSHKFGERSLLDPETQENIQQFHDCGIVYYEKYPYLLCVMTKGNTDFERLEGIVENVSLKVFETIITTYK